MNFNTTNDPNEFDFSILFGTNECYGPVVHADKPENICEEIFQILCDCIDEGEYRFVGIIDDDNYFIHRTYKRNGRIWENVWFDDLVDMLNSVRNKNHLHRIHNCLMY